MKTCRFEGRPPYDPPPRRLTGEVPGPKEQPILFSAPMVRAILAGQKTQTRRVVKWPESLSGSFEHLRPDAAALIAEGHKVVDANCPFGQPGDRLWVRETWRVMNAGLRTIALRASPDRHGGHHLSREDDAWWDRWGARSDGRRWQPSIYMPRWASRITLEVTSVRVERLHDITEDDARAEGVDWSRPEPYGEKWDDDDREDPREVGYPPAGASFARDNFRRLWSGINGPESWDANPFVWCIKFRG